MSSSPIRLSLRTAAASVTELQAIEAVTPAAVTLDNTPKAFVVRFTFSPEAFAGTVRQRLSACDAMAELQREARSR